MTPILQTRLPNAPWLDPRQRRLPGILPLEVADWLQIDEAYGRQMAERARLIAARPDAVLARRCPTPGAAEFELRDAVLDWLARHGPGFEVGPDRVRCPDGRVVALSDDPMRDLGQIVQEDFCLLFKPDGATEHILDAAILCFPASWSLAEKLGRPLAAIHGPVPDYDTGLAARVQRLFDGIRPEAPLWRQNALIYHDPTLFQPRREATPRPQSANAPYLRSERQSLMRLPKSGAVVFSIHTYVLALDNLTQAQYAGLDAVTQVSTGAA